MQIAFTQLTWEIAAFHTESKEEMGAHIVLAHLSDCAEYYNTQCHSLSVMCSLRLRHLLTHVKGGILLARTT